MARVVERRKGTPWALIVIVFLFLIAATLAALWRMEADEQKNTADKRQREIEYYTKQVPSQGALEAMLNTAKQSGRGVLRQLADREQPLIDLIMGPDSKATIEQATAKARETLGSVPRADETSPSVNLAIEKLLAESRVDKQKIASLEEARDKTGEEVKGLQKRIAEMERARDKAAADFREQITKLTSEKGDIDTKHKAERAQMKKQFEERIEQLNVEYNKTLGDLDKAKATIRKQDGEIALWRKKIDDILRPQRMRTVAYQADGKVTQTRPEDNIVYINIGERDRVMAGLTFSVYPAEKGMPQVRKDDGTIVEAQKLKGKAQIYVLQTFEKISLCRIEWQASPGDPVIPGDLVANLAFDAQRSYRFVVIGDFDLYSSGTPQEADGEHVKHLIRRFRGEVSKEVDDQTDFLVVGTKPVDTPAAEGEETEHLRKVRQEKEKRRAEYERTRRVAEVRDIPILNANQFLALVGYTPQNPLRSFGPEGR